MASNDWVKDKDDYPDGRMVWHTKDHHYGLVVNPMAFGGKWHVGYSHISNPNFVTLKEDVTKKEAMKTAKNFMKNKRVKHNA